MRVDRQYGSVWTVATPARNITMWRNMWGWNIWGAPSSSVTFVTRYVHQGVRTGLTCGDIINNIKDINRSHLGEKSSNVLGNKNLQLKEAFWFQWGFFRPPPALGGRPVPLWIQLWIQHCKALWHEEAHRSKARGLRGLHLSPLWLSHPNLKLPEDAHKQET